MVPLNAVNRANTTATCRTSVNRHMVCQVILKVLSMHETPTCVVNSNGTLDCAAASLQAQWARTPQGRTIIAMNGSNPDSSSSEIITYSFFDGGEWVRCQKVDAEGVVVGVSTFAANGTQTIRCPIRLDGGPRPVIIRIEESSRSTVSAALPIFGGGASDKPKFTYFSVFVNSTLLIDGGDGDQEEKTFFVLAAGMALLLVALLLVICALITVALKRRRNRLRKQAKSSFYADLDMAEKNSASSMATDTTYLYEK